MIWWYMYYDLVLLLSETVPDRDEWTVGVSTANSAGDDQDRQRETIRTPLSEERTEQTRTGPHNNALIRKINKSIKPSIYKFFFCSRENTQFSFISKEIQCTLKVCPFSLSVRAVLTMHYGNDKDKHPIAWVTLCTIIFHLTGENQKERGSERSSFNWHYRQFNQVSLDHASIFVSQMMKEIN